MLSIRYRPLFDFRRELDEMRSQLDGLFGSALRQTPLALNPTTFPLVNAWEDNDCYYLEAELPGLTIDDLEITMIDASTVNIKGRRQEPTVEGVRWHRRERGYGEFERRVELPGAVDADHVEGSFKHGVLTVKLPKAPELRPRKIEVKTA